MTNTRTCIHCGQEKPLDKFSLVKRQSDDRKRYCTTCESMQKTARKYDMTLEQYRKLFEYPCYFCRKEPYQVIANKDNRILAVVCRKCYQTWRHLNNDDLFARYTAFLLFADRFPFVIRMLHPLPTPASPTPLIKYIHDKDRD